MSAIDSVAPVSRAAALRTVGRIAVLNIAVLIVFQTGFPGASSALVFDPSQPLERPWAVLTYVVAHTGLAHVLLLAGALLAVGPIVMRRLGLAGFAGYFLACTVGGGVLGVILSGFFDIPPLAGSLAPVLGITVAAAWVLEDDELNLEPLPFRLRLRTLLGLVAPLLAGAGVLAQSAALSPAHLGGLLTGLLWFRLRAPARRQASPPRLPTRRAVMTPVRLEVPESSPARPRVPPVPPASSDVPRVPQAVAGPGDVDRLLDKISAHGLDSLTDHERRLLSEYSEQKRREGP